MVNRPPAQQGQQARPSLLERWIAGVQRRPRQVLAVACVLAIFGALYTAGHLGFKTERRDLVDPTKPYARDRERFMAEFDDQSDIIFIVEGTNRPRMQQAIEALAHELESLPEYFTQVHYKVNIDNLRRKGLYQLPISQLADVHQQLKLREPVLRGGWQWLTLDRVLAHTEMMLRLAPREGTASMGLNQSVANATRLLESLGGQIQDGQIYRSPWQRMASGLAVGEQAKGPRYLWTADGKMALLRATPVRQAGDFSGLNPSVKLAHQAVANVRAQFPGQSFGVTGLPVLEADEMKAAKRSGIRSMLLSIIGVGLLFITAFRALRHPLFAVVSLIIAGAWTLWWVTLTVGHLNVLSVSFIVTLVGLGIDFGILWISRFERHRADGMATRDSNLASARGVGRGIVVGGLTTAAAFLTTTITGFLGLREMGWIAASGVVFCLISAVTVLPALLVLAGQKRFPAGLNREDSGPAFPMIARRPWTVLGLGLAVVIIASLKLPQVHFDYNLLNLQAQTLDSVRWEKRLLAKSDVSCWHAVSLADNAEQARKMKHQFESLPSVGRVVELASLIPAHQKEKEPLVRDIHQLVKNVPAKNALAVLENPKQVSSNLMKVLAQLQQTLLELQEDPATARPSLHRLAQAVKVIGKQLSDLEIDDRAARLAHYHRLWTYDLLDQLHQLKASANPNPVTVADLPPGLAKRYQGKTGKWLLQVFARDAVWDLDPLEQFCRDVYSVDPHATGEPISALLSLRDMNEGFVRSGWLAGLIILGLVWLATWSFRKAVLAMIPLSAGAIMTFGLMGWFGIDLNPANMIALPLVLGIGIDFGVHVIQEFKPGNGPFVLEWGLGRALSLTGMTTLVGFASLLTAEHWGMVSIGLVLALGVASCSISALVLLPALLTILSAREPHSEMVSVHELPSTVIITPPLEFPDDSQHPKALPAKTDDNASKKAA